MQFFLHGIGILFEMDINPSISSSTFLSLDNLSQFEQEREILFLMHSVFRIGKIDKLEERLWHVKLTLTDDNDGELSQHTQYFRDEIRQESGWNRMGVFMLRLGKLDKALEIYNSTLEVTCDGDKVLVDIERVVKGIRTASAWIGIGKYTSTVSNFEKSLQILQRYFSPDTILFATVYVNISIAQSGMGDYAAALANLEKAQEIFQRSSLCSRPIMALIYHMAGLLHFERVIIKLHYQKLRNPWKFNERFFLNIILTWLLLATILLSVTNFCVISRRHSNITKKH